MSLVAPVENGKFVETVSQDTDIPCAVGVDCGVVESEISAVLDVHITSVCAFKIKDWLDVHDFVKAHIVNQGVHLV